MARNNIVRWLGISAYVVCGILIVMFVLPLFGWKALEVMTPSMKPAISPGDLVIVHRVPLASIHPGNVVTYLNLHEPGTTITHRVESVKTIKGVPSYIVKGDANKSPDAPVAGGQIVGRVATVVPGLGSLANLLHNPIGLLALVILPAIYVIWSEVKNLRRLIKSPKRRGTRRLDGLYRITLVLLVGAVIISVGGATFAALTSSASLTGNMLAVKSTAAPSAPTTTPSPSPSPSPCSISISNTGPGSTNIVHCSQSSTTSTSSSTSVSVSNQSTQTATSGGITIENNTSAGTITPGSISNSSSSVTNISITK